MIRSSHSLLTVALLSAASLAGCADPGGPGAGQDRFDTRKVRGGVAAIERVNDSPVLRSFRTLGGQVASVNTAIRAGDGPASADRVARLVRDLAGTLAPTGGPATIPVIRSSILGKTLVYDPAAKKYVVAEGRTGAPSNGVRLVLYETGPDDQPNVAKEIGHADLTDERATSPTTAGLRLVVVSAGITHLDYRFDLTGSIGAATVTVAGFMSDGTERINFELVTTGQLFGRGGTVTLDAKLEVPGHDFKVAVKAVGTAGDDSAPGQIQLTVTAGSDVVAIDAKWSVGKVDASVRVNSQLFATIEGDPVNPVIKGAGGRELTAEELATLGSLFQFTEGIFALLAGLLAPAGALLLLGLGL
jgi:hypothetical protein